MRTAGQIFLSVVSEQEKLPGSPAASMFPLPLACTVYSSKEYSASELSEAKIFSFARFRHCSASCRFRQYRLYVRAEERITRSRSHSERDIREKIVRIVRSITAAASTVNTAFTFFVIRSPPFLRIFSSNHCPRSTLLSACKNKDPVRKPEKRQISDRCLRRQLLSPNLNHSP